MQAIAAEMNLSETVFFAPEPDGEAYGIRWFTPAHEVDLIGDATLAAGYLVLEKIQPTAEAVRFVSGGNRFTAGRDGTALTLEVPALRPHAIEGPSALARGLGRAPAAVLAAKHYLCVFADPADITALAPDMTALAALELPAVIVTAPSSGDAEFVSRFFAPANGVPEDPVSAVAHLCFAPYWTERLGKKRLVGRQLSQRGGIVRCEDRNDRTRLGGSAAIFLEGRIAA